MSERRRAFESHPRTDVIGLIPQIEIRRQRRFLPRNWRTDHRPAVHQRVWISIDVREDDDVELVEPSRPAERLVAYVNVGDAHLVEGVPHPLSLIHISEPT